MFKCAKCFEDVGPGIKPNLIPAGYRDVSYSVLKRDEEGELVRSVASGRELIGEFQVCFTCLGIPTPTKVEQNWAPIRNAVNGFTKDHVRGCKKDLADCYKCRRFISDLSNLPRPGISEAVEPLMAPSFRFNMAEIVVANVGLRASHASKRATLDVQAAYEHVAPYARRMGENKKGKQS